MELSAPLRRPAFRRLASTFLINELGDWLGLIALGVLVFDRTDSALATTGLFLGTRFVPALLTPPLAWFAFVYLAWLALLLVTAFWQINSFTTRIEQVWTLDNFQTLLTDPTYRVIVGRTVGMAAAVTLTDAVLAFPIAYFMARLATRRIQTLLFAAVLLPLWASYLARVYAWILILAHNGILNSTLLALHLPAGCARRNPAAKPRAAPSSQSPD